MRTINYAYKLPEETRERIIHYNKLIAQYMGYIYFPHNYVSESGKHVEPGWKLHENVSNVTKMNRGINDFLCRNNNDLAYHFDWNWINFVISELYKRNAYIIYSIGVSAYSWHNDDFVVLGSPTAGKPVHFNHIATVKNVEDRIMAVWEVVAFTIEYLITNNIAKIPTVTSYKRQIIPGVDATDDELKKFIDDINDLPGNKD